jgi:hypothetical protein
MLLLSGREIKFARDIARYVMTAQLTLKLFGWSGGLHAWSGVTILFYIPVDLVQWPRSGGGLCAGFRELGGMCRVREGEEVRMTKSLDHMQHVHQSRN